MPSTRVLAAASILMLLAGGCGRDRDLSQIRDPLERADWRVAHERGADTLYERANLRYGQQQDDGAIADLDAAIAYTGPRPFQRDSLSLAYELRAWAHERLGHDAEAVADFGRSLAADPHFFGQTDMRKTERVKLLLKLARLDEVEAIAAEMLAHGPSAADFPDGLAIMASAYSARP